MGSIARKMKKELTLLFFKCWFKKTPLSDILLGGDKYLEEQENKSEDELKIMKSLEDKIRLHTDVVKGLRRLKKRRRRL